MSNQIVPEFGTPLPLSVAEISLYDFIAQHRSGVTTPTIKDTWMYANGVTSPWLGDMLGKGVSLGYLSKTFFIIHRRKTASYTRLPKPLPPAKPVTPATP